MPEFEIVFRPQAEADLQEIYNYTLVNWGREQALSYREKIQHAVKGLIANPKIGKDRPDVKEGYRSLVVEKHIIFYQIGGKEIRIIGIVHSSMDFVNRFL